MEAVEAVVKWDDVKYAVVFVAVRFAREHEGRYEIDELVNEAWLRLQRYPIEYIEAIWTASWRAMQTYHLHMTRRTYCREAMELIADVCAIKDDGYEAVDTMDTVERVMKGLSPRRVDILGCRFSGMSFRQTGVVMGLSGERVRQLCKESRRLLKRIQEKENEDVYTKDVDHSGVDCCAGV